MEGELRHDHRPRYGVRQATVAIVASLLIVGTVAIASDDDARSRIAVVPSPTTTASTTGSTTGSTTASTATPGTAVTAVTPAASIDIATSAAITAETTATTAAATVAIGTAPTTAAAAVPVGLPAVDAKAFAVYDATAGSWLAEVNADAALAVGSVMKLLTAYVVLQAGDLAKVVTVPSLQMNIAESAIGLYAGEQLPRDVLLRAMLIVSANDAARALAIDIGGSTDGFVQQMNGAAELLGLSNTVAANPVGLDASGAYSSAKDMVTLAASLMQDETFRAAVAKPSASLHGQTFPATNKLLRSYEGADGVKTGHTTEAGYCLVGSATRNGRTVIVAVLGAPTEAVRLAGATALLDWAFTTT